MKNFKQLRTWQVGMQISLLAFRLAEGFPKEEKFGLSSQLTRAAVSIPANIAEGSSRQSEKEYARYLELSMGSCFEAETLLLIACQMNFGDKELREILLSLIESENRMLHSFLAKLKSC